MGARSARPAASTACAGAPSRQAADLRRSLAPRQFIDEVVVQCGQRIAEPQVAIADAHARRQRLARPLVEQRRAPGLWRGDAARRDGRQAAFGQVGLQRQVDAADGGDLFLPVGAAYRRLDDHEASVAAIPLELDAADALVSGDLDEALRFACNRVPVLARLDADRRAADIGRIAHELASAEHGHHAARAVADEQREVDVGVAAHDPFLYDDAARSRQHARSRRFRLREGFDPHGAFGTAAEHLHLVGGLEHQRQRQLVQRGRQFVGAADDRRARHREAVLLREALERGLVGQHANLVGRR